MPPKLDGSAARRGGLRLGIALGLAGLLSVCGTLTFGLPAGARPTPGASAPPAAALSRYMRTTDPHLVRPWGCALGRQAVRRATVRDALVVLDFGRPMRVKHKFGTSLFRVGFRDTAHIRRAVQSYVQGFAACSRSVPQARLQVAIGTSNWGHQVTFLHGRAWP